MGQPPSRRTVAVGISLLAGGFVVALVGGWVTVLGGICGIAGNCTSTDNAVAAIGVLLIAVGILGAAVVAVVLTKQWWWLVSPLVIGAAIVGYTYNQNAVQNQQSAQSERDLSTLSQVRAILQSTVSLQMGPLAPPADADAQRQEVQQRTAINANLLVQAEPSLARRGLLLGSEPEGRFFNVRYQGQPYCLEIPFAPTYSIAPGRCATPG